MSAQEHGDSAIYQGLSLKLDVATPILELARSQGKIQNYEMAINVRVANRFYPTIELGYAQAETSADGGNYSGQGGFARLFEKSKHLRDREVGISRTNRTPSYTSGVH